MAVKLRFDFFNPFCQFNDLKYKNYDFNLVSDFLSMFFVTSYTSNDSHRWSQVRSQPRRLNY